MLNHVKNYNEQNVDIDILELKSIIPEIAFIWKNIFVSPWELALWIIYQFNWNRVISSIWLRNSSLKSIILIESFDINTFIPAESTVFSSYENTFPEQEVFLNILNTQNLNVWELILFIQKQCYNLWNWNNCFDSALFGITELIIKEDKWELIIKEDFRRRVSQLLYWKNNQ